jgi:ParB family chromosome partitioning protein
MAYEMLEIETLPVIVRELDDRQEVDVQVDSNLLHRERILPSEKAWAYRLKMETLNHNGKKSTKHSHEILTEQTGESVFNPVGEHTFPTYFANNQNE